MILPVSYTSALLLLITSLICLGCWVNTFKAAGPRWRFELFSIDFSIGAMFLVLLVAFTLGMLGSDLGFSDRILVAGRTAQGLAIVAGGVFNLGNMLLLAAISLLGITTAFPLSVGVALIVSSCLHFRPTNMVYLIVGSVIMLASVLLEIRSAQLHEPVVASKKDPAPVDPPQPATAARIANNNLRGRTGRQSKPPSPTLKSKHRKRSVRGIIAAIVSGVAFGCFPLVLQNCVPGDLGLGAYAAMLLFGIGVLVSTIVYDLYFLNIAIEGSPLTFGAYFGGTARQHILGITGGVICAAGLLAALLAVEVPASANVSPTLTVIVPLLSVPLAFFFGVTRWRELASVTRAKASIVAGISLFIGSLILLSFGFTQ